MHRTALLWLILAAFCGIALFHTSQKVNDGREHLVLLEQNTLKEKEDLRVLQAEWSYLNKPERLEKLARQHLGLQPMKNKQFIALAELATPSTDVAERSMATSEIKIKKTSDVAPLSSPKLPAPSVVWSPGQKGLVSAQGGH